MAKRRTSRAIEIRRLDKLHEISWPKALEGDEAALERCLNIITLRSKLLGLTRRQPRKRKPRRNAALTPH
jgi:hypothetical protein